MISQPDILANLFGGLVDSELTAPEGLLIAAVFGALLTAATNIVGQRGRRQVKDEMVADAESRIGTPNGSGSVVVMAEKTLEGLAQLQNSVLAAQTQHSVEHHDLRTAVAAIDTRVAAIDTRVAANTDILIDHAGRLEDHAAKLEEHIARQAAKQGDGR